MTFILTRDQHSLSTYHVVRVVADRYIQSTCATSGEGLYEGLDWLSSNIASKVYTYGIQIYSFDLEMFHLFYLFLMHSLFEIPFLTTTST